MGLFSLKNLWILLDASLVLGYLGFILYKGVQSGKNVKNLKDFAVSNRNFSNTAILATILATIIGGEAIFGVSERAFSVGLVNSVAVLGWPISIYLTSKFLAPRVSRFLKSLSVGQIMGELYGTAGRVITGGATFLICSGFVATEMSVIGYLFNYFTGLPHILGMIIGCGVVITYSAFGGIRSVVITDVIQFTFIILMVPLVFLASYFYLSQYSDGSHLSTINMILSNVPEHHINIFSFDNDWVFYISIFFFNLFATLDPSFTHRLLIAKKSFQAKKVFHGASFLVVGIYLSFVLITLMGHSIVPSSSPDTVFIDVINKVMLPGLKGLAITGLLAAIMSSSDSDLNVASIAVINDVIKPLLREKTLTDKQELLIARLSTVTLGFLAIIIAFKIKKIFFIMLYAANFWAPVVVVPLVAGFFHREGSTKTFLISATTGAVVVLFWNVFLEDVTHVIGILPAMIANGTAFLLSRRYLDGIKWSECINGDEWRRGGRNKQSLLSYLQGKIGAFEYVYDNKLSSFLMRVFDLRAHSYGTVNFTFGVIGIVVFMSPIFWFQSSFDSLQLSVVLRAIGGFLCTGLILKTYWKKGKAERYFSLYWFFTLSYCLSFFPSFSLLQSGCSTISVINATMLTGMLISFVDWKMFVVTQGFGLLCGSLLFRLIYGVESFPSGEQYSHVVYAYCMTALISFTFAIDRKNITRHKIDLMFRRITPILRNRFYNNMAFLYNDADEIDKDVVKLKEEHPSLELDTLEGMVKNRTDRMRHMASEFNAFVHLTDKNAVGNSTNMHKGFCMASVIEEIKKILTLKDLVRRLEGIELILHEENDFELPNDNDMVCLLIYNLVMNSIHQIDLNRKKNGRIEIWIVAHDNGRHELHVKDNGGGVNEVYIDRIFDTFFSGDFAGIGIGLSYCKQVMLAIEGYIDLVNKPGESAEFILHFPKWIKRDLGWGPVIPQHKKTF